MPAKTARADAGVIDDASSAAREAARRQQVLARGEGVQVTVGDVEDAIAQQGAGARARYTARTRGGVGRVTRGDEVALKALVASLVRAELLADEAERRGYENQAPVRYLTKDSAAQALVRSEIEDKVTPESVAEQDVRAYYDAHPAEFHRHAMRRASQIVVDGETEAERLAQQAQGVDARGFAELAKAHSKDVETKAQGGDLGYFAAAPENDPPRAKGQPAIEPHVRQAVFGLAEVGDVSRPVALAAPGIALAPDAALRQQAQRAIVRFAAERPERHASLDDATLTIRAKLWREQRQRALDQLYGKLRARDKPQVFTDRIYLINFDDMEKRPSGFAPDPPAPVATRPAPAAQKAQPPAKAP